MSRMEGAKTFRTVEELDLNLENVGAEVQIIDQDGRQWISLVIDGGESSYDLTMGDAQNLRIALAQAVARLI